jgi:hypothetical protein
MGLDFPDLGMAFLEILFLLALGISKEFPH